MEGKLNGIELTGDEAVQMNNVVQKLNELKRVYAENVETATSKFRQLLIDPQYIGEMPVQLLRNLAKDKYVVQSYMLLNDQLMYICLYLPKM